VSLSFVGRFGQILIAPRAAMERIEREGGGFRDAVILIALGTITLRFPQLAEALLGLTQPSRGTILRVVGVFSNEARDALMIIPATLGIVLLGGRRRDPNLDLEIGSACFAPFFTARAVERVGFAIAGHPLPSGSSIGSNIVAYGPATLWAAWVFMQALRAAWARPDPRAVAAADGVVSTPPEVPAAEPDAPSLNDSSPPAPPEVAPPVVGAPVPVPGPRARRAGFAALALLVVGLGFNIAWASRHFDALRPMEHGEAAPEIDLPRIDATPGRLKLSSLRGKVVLLDFWATWCPPCVAMIPVLHDLHHEWAPRGVEFVGVDSDGPQSTVQDVRDFLVEHPAPYPIVMDDGTANTLYKIRALPQMVLIDREGAVRRVFIGITTRHELASAFAEVLGQPGEGAPAQR
jgi:thiol-disulfide isomerase/thioredoxin